MIETILALIGGLKGLILGGISLLSVLFGLFWKGRFNRERREKEEYQQANKIYQAKEKVHEQDQILETEADQKIEEIHEKVDRAETPEAGAGIVAEELNKYFGGKK